MDDIKSAISFSSASTGFTGGGLGRGWGTKGEAVLGLGVAVVVEVGLGRDFLSGLLFPAIFSWAGVSELSRLPFWVLFLRRSSLSSAARASTWSFDVGV